MLVKAHEGGDCGGRLAERPLRDDDRSIGRVAVEIDDPQ
jgi:hypothetical protein